MLQKVKLRKKASFEAYQDVIAPRLCSEVLKLAKKLKGLKVVHINATPKGGGVAEILKSLIPLMNDAGIKASWYTITPDDVLFKITKGFHNALQGSHRAFLFWPLNFQARRIYLDRAKKMAEKMRKIKADVWVIHDPQPLAVIAYNHIKRAVWRCHIDTSDPDERIWNFLVPYINQYDRLIFTAQDFVHKDLPQDKVRFVPPAIDPFSLKNNTITKERAKKILQKLGINSTRPLITQVARFDIWKDPMGVINNYYLVKEKFPDVQLALVGFFLAQDDPEGLEVLTRVKKHAKGDPDIFMFSDLKQAKGLPIDLVVNAFQVGSDVIYQKSIREGFGMTITEAMWKGTPVIGGNVGGLKLQIKNGRTGYLVDSVEECAEKTVKLLKNPALCDMIGQRGKESVRAKFLMPRLMRDHFKIYKELM